MPESRPRWLPDMISVNGEWNDVVARLYAIFDRDFRQVGCAFDTHPVSWDSRKLDNSPYEEGFWHLITAQDYQLGERLPDFRRAERLPWCRPTIVNSSDPGVRLWDYQEGKGHTRTYIWLENWDYVVILERRPHKGRRTTAHLVTAFHVGGNNTRAKLRKKYAKRVDAP